jgi:hypothetical protein
VPICVRGPARALFDYAAQADGDLTIHADDVIEVLNEDAGGGWMEGKIVACDAAGGRPRSVAQQRCGLGMGLAGQLNGKKGQFPANYVELL